MLNPDPAQRLPDMTRVAERLRDVLEEEEAARGARRGAAPAPARPRNRRRTLARRARTRSAPELVWTAPEGAQTSIGSSWRSGRIPRSSMIIRSGPTLGPWTYLDKSTLISGLLRLH